MIGETMKKEAVTILEEGERTFYNVDVYHRRQRLD